MLIEDQLAKYDDKINKEVAKAAKRFGEAFDEAQFRSTNGRVLEHQAKRDALHERFAKALNDNNLEELRQIIVDEDTQCRLRTKIDLHRTIGTGYLCQLSERTEDRPHESSFRYRSDR